MASEFLPDICGVFMSHLFQRCLFEYHDYNLELIEKAWNNICDHCPLAALLTGMSDVLTFFKNLMQFDDFFYNFQDKL